jgi:hypothetical protein
MLIVPPIMAPTHVERQRAVRHAFNNLQQSRVKALIYPSRPVG